MKIAGVDEAGRGCVIGPLVIAGAVFNESDEQKLKDIGVKDSKLISPKKRIKLAHKIKEIAVNIKIVEIQPKVIDKVVFRNKPLRRLNYLETMIMAKIIRELRPDKAYVDPCDVNSDRCIQQILRVLDFIPEIICHPKADNTYVTTGAASILAKVRRDEVISELREIHGDFNSGYPSDKKTISFIQEYFRRTNDCPMFIRESWSTIQRYITKPNDLR